ncbi:MAG: LytTR family DNA-binding domain-containing protein [Saprospiraceae bacterium]
MRLSVLTADDEPHARRYIKSLLAKDTDVEVVYECKNGQEVLNFLKNKVPSILFLDINMPGISGIEVAEKLKNTDTLIIFSTAYDQYALKAFELEAFDYLLKPFEEIRFFEVLNRAKLSIERFRQATFSEKFAELYKAYNKSIVPHLTEFVMKEKGFEKRIPIDDIIYIEANTIYAGLHLKKGMVLYRATLNLLEQQLPPNFMRVHRSFILNCDYIKSLKYLNNSTYQITMINEDVVISSRRYKDGITKHLA